MSGKPDLLRLVLRRAGWVAGAVFVLALLLGLQRMAADIDDEVQAAQALAGLLAGLQPLQALDDAAALAAVRALQQQPPTRHLRLHLHDARGRELLAPPPEPVSPVMGGLLDLHRRWGARVEPRSVSWPLPRPDGSRWTVTLQASHEGERHEALLNLLGMLGLLLLAVAGLLLVLRWNLRTALAPLQALLQAIARIEQRDVAAAQALPPMPVRELEAVSQALQHLSLALQAAESERRALGQRVITLQEDERARLARELHDEFGQQLTALHVDAAWLARRLHDDPPALAVVQSVIGHCRHIQQELRSVLARLRPLADGGVDEGGPRTLGALHELLQSLVDGWQRAPAPSAQVRLQVRGAADAPLPAALSLALYRITQEALTNVARHAGARSAQVDLQLGRDGLRWQVADDGVGLADPAAALLRGSGLAGIKERVWALGSELAIEPLQPGLRLSALFRTWERSEPPAQPG